ncbi:MAG TPA: hypothetical protein VFJ58_20930 [Armatimonadota bacterium]|nr:hypothetical protein [Armatimonadota bacterium]
MADLVMTVNSATARRDGARVVVNISGEKANSRDEVYAETGHGGSTADVHVRVRPAAGFGTEMTGPFSLSATIESADDVKRVRVHGKNGVKEVAVN